MPAENFVSYCCYGDPYLVPERVWYVANRLRFSGITEIRGDLVVDDTFFDGQRMAHGHEQDHSSYAYMAPTGAASVGFNAILVHVRPAADMRSAATVLVEPASSYATVRGRVRTTRRGRSDVRISVVPHGDRSQVRVSGRITADEGPRSYWRRIDNPPVFLGDVLHEALRQVGISVAGQVRCAAAPEDSTILVTHRSPPLAELLRRLNKHSNNFMAAQVARTLGAEVYGAPGSWEKAERALSAFLVDEVGLKAGSFTYAKRQRPARRQPPHAKANRADPTVHVRRSRRAPEFLTSMAVAAGVSNTKLNQEHKKKKKNITQRLLSTSGLGPCTTAARWRRNGGPCREANGPGPSSCPSRRRGRAARAR